MNPLLFLKFNEEKHIETLRNKGEIFMRLNNDFRKFDSNKERFDKFEGALSNEYISEGIIEIKTEEWPEWKKLKILNSNFNQFIDTSKIYSYSLYLITLADLQEIDIYRVDKRMSEFGSHFLMIRNPNDFLNKIANYLELNEFEYCFKEVSYYNLQEKQIDLTLFHKPNTLKHQKEFRIIVKAKTEQPLKFEIGNIENYSEIYKSKILEHFLMKL
jgi:hypothetical protein